MKTPIYILAIESSCDDTSAAVFENNKILANIIHSQTIHQQWGGVVPELASRAHTQNILPVVQEALRQAKVELKQLSAIAFTQGPGLMGALLVGSSFAKGLALALQIPLIGVHHMQAHIMAHFIHPPFPSFPFLCLTVSGGHTQLVIVKADFQFEIIGETLDDAAGEAFDKTAKMLGLPYPGGPLIDKYAQEGNPLRFQFSIPKNPSLDFSFSGFKTSVLYFLQKEKQKNNNFITENLKDLCASIQHHIVHYLVNQTLTAAGQYHIHQIAIAGGVSANSGLRKVFLEATQKMKMSWFVPEMQYCTDNAAMIGITAYHKFINHEYTPAEAVPVAHLKF